MFLASLYDPRIHCKFRVVLANLSCTSRVMQLIFHTKAQPESYIACMATCLLLGNNMLVVNYVFCVTDFLTETVWLVIQDKLSGCDFIIMVKLEY